MGQWRHSSALSPSRSRNFCSPGPRYSMIGSSNRPTLPPLPVLLYSPHSSGTRLRHILERSSCIHRYWAPAVISRWIIYSKSSMRVTGQIRMISSSSLFLFFFLFYFPPSEYLTDLFAELIISLFLLGEIRFCGFSFFWSMLMKFITFIVNIFSGEVIYFGLFVKLEI